MTSFLFLRAEEMRLRRVRQRVRAFIDLAGDKGELGAVDGKWAMLTVTYADAGGWEAWHVSGLVDCLYQWMKRRGYKLVYVWVAELQVQRWRTFGGVPAVHYHLLIKLPKGLTLPKPDKQGWWKHGWTKVEWVRKSGKRYAAKYCSKEFQKTGFAGHYKGLRICGAGGLPKWARAWWSWLLSPAYVRAECEPSDLPKRFDGGWRLSDGTFIASPWTATPVPEWGGVILQRKTERAWIADCLGRPGLKEYLWRLDGYRRGVLPCPVEPLHPVWKLPRWVDDVLRLKRDMARGEWSAGKDAALVESSREMRLYAARMPAVGRLP